MSVCLLCELKPGIYLFVFLICELNSLDICDVLNKGLGYLCVLSNVWIEGLV